jgi:hypothetical protein
VWAWVPFFTSGSDLHPPRESAGVGADFIFYSWVTHGYPKFQILMVSTQPAHLNFSQPQHFGPAQQYPPLKSYTITLGGVHLTHQLCSSLGALIRRDLVIELTSTLLKSTGDPKLDGCGRRCDFSSVGVTVGGCHGWVFVKPTPNQSRCHPK